MVILAETLPPSDDFNVKAMPGVGGILQQINEV